MNQIITISREFGSGGRELGKHLSEILGIAYYDHEIIKGISERTGLAEKYVSSIVEKQTAMDYPIAIGRTLGSKLGPQFHIGIKIYTEQSNLIRELADKSDCLIMGRCSDYILREHDPFNIFVHASMASRLLRCRRRAPENENMSDEEMKNNIRRIDESRARYYEFFTQQKWGAKENYTLCINTSNTVINEISWPIAELLQAEIYGRKR